MTERAAAATSLLFIEYIYCSMIEVSLATRPLNLCVLQAVSTGAGRNDSHYYVDGTVC
jgi:hypothetical protein